MNTDTSSQAQQRDHFGAHKMNSPSINVAIKILESLREQSFASACRFWTVNEISALIYTEQAQVQHACDELADRDLIEKDIKISSYRASPGIRRKSNHHLKHVVIEEFGMNAWATFTGEKAHRPVQHANGIRHSRSKSNRLTYLDEESPLHFLGYQVGLNGLRRSERREFLRDFFELEELPICIDEVIARQWGSGHSDTRLRMMISHIRNMAWMFGRNDGDKYRDAIAEWEDDADWLSTLIQNTT